MANITEYLNRIKSAVLGKDVRDSIHDAIEAINDEVEEVPVVDIVQNTGASTTSIMSQKAVTDNLSSKADLVNGRIPYSQLPESAMEFKGTWNANTNTPTLTNGTGDIGDFYIVSTAGTSLGQTFKINDRVLYDGSLWIKLSGGEVTSVNGKTGNVALSASDVGALPDDTSIPVNLSDLNDDSTHRLVSDADTQAWNEKSTVSFTQDQTTGTKIGTITINEQSIDIYAPTGGGGGGGDMYAATYDPQSAVATAGGIPAYVSTQIAAAITNAIGGGY